MTFSDLVKPGMNAKIKIASGVYGYSYKGEKLPKKEFELICNYLHTLYKDNDLGIEELGDIVDLFFVQLNCNNFKINDITKNKIKVNKVMLARIERI